MARRLVAAEAETAMNALEAAGMLALLGALGCGEVPLEAAHVHEGERVTITLPGRADGAAEIRDRASGVTARVRLLAAPEIPARLRDGVVVYAGEPEIAIRWHDDGFEDFVSYREPPREPRLRYRLDPVAAGLRSVGGSLELLDAGGAPRIRMSPPYLVDAGGTRHPIPLSIEGCEPDRDPRPPWGRTLSSATPCTLVLDWSELELSYPVLIDPAWTSAAALSAARAAPMVVLAERGFVLAAGGRSGLAHHATCELYDEQSDTWALTEPLPAARHGHGLVAATGGALLVGGCAEHQPLYWTACAPQATVWRYDPGAPNGSLWTAVTPLAEPRARHATTVLGDGRVIVVGGQAVDDPSAVLTSTELFDGVSWSTAAPTHHRHLISAIATLPDGNAAIAGGYSHVEVVGNETISHESDTAEIYDSVADTWLDLPPSSMKRANTRLIALPDGRLLLAGGRHDTNALASAEIFDAASWVDTKPMTAAHDGFRAALLPSGWVVAVGGRGTQLVEAYPASGDPLTAIWQPIASLPENRQGFGMVLLPGGDLFVAGGFNDGGGALASARRLSFALIGEPCTTGASCASGHCIDERCCETECGACATCAAALGSPRDGLCGPVPDGAPDPRGICSDAGACGTNGLCAAGACALAAAGASCAECPAGGTGSCDGVGSCVCGSARCLDETTHRDAGGVETSCHPYRCSEAGCTTSCASAAECADGYLCDRERRCVVPVEYDDAPGCGCLTAGRNGWRAGAAGWLVLLVVGARRRRCRVSPGC
jgi:hypothetical protein